MTGRLLDYLQGHANADGLVLASEMRMIARLKTSHEHLVEALKELESQGKIDILSPLPLLVLKLRSWSGSSSSRVRNEQQISSHAARVHSEVPVSSRAAAATQQEDGGVGEGVALLGEVLAALGPEADPAEFRQILADYHPALIRRCLNRVLTTKTIRVSRAALFRSLLQKLSH